MKDFTINGFSFGLLSKEENLFKFNLISEHPSLQLYLEDNQLAAIIDTGVLLRNHIIKSTANHYLYFISKLDVGDDISIQVSRRKFSPEIINKALVRQSIRLESYKKKVDEEVEVEVREVSLPSFRYGTGMGGNSGGRISDVYIYPPIPNDYWNLSSSNPRIVAQTGSYVAGSNITGVWPSVLEIRMPNSPTSNQNAIY